MADSASKPTDGITWQLYTREDCGLCEVAEALLKDQGCRYHTVNIDRSLTLIQRYGDRIPVIVDIESGTELQWPFTAEDLRSL